MAELIRSLIRPFLQPFIHPFIFRHTSYIKHRLLKHSAWYKLVAEWIFWEQRLPTVHNKFQPRWLSGDHRDQKRHQDERIHLSWGSVECKRIPIKLLNPTKRSREIPLLPCSLCGSTPICRVPELCQRLLVPVLLVGVLRSVQFSKVGVSGSTSETKGKKGGECILTAGPSGWKVALEIMTINTFLLVCNYRRVWL